MTNQPLTSTYLLVDESRRGQGRENRGRRTALHEAIQGQPAHSTIEDLVIQIKNGKCVIVSPIWGSVVPYLDFLI